MSVNWLRTRSRLAQAVVLVAAMTAAMTSGAGPHEARAAVTDRGGEPVNCRFDGEAVFWTASDWVLLGQALAADASPCVDYYIVIPPLAADKTGLRPPQDDLIRALGPQFHPVAEMALGTLTGWNVWVHAVPGRTWFDAGVEFRRRMVAAGYRFDLGETWLLNEFDGSTRRDEEPYSRAAMKELLRGLYNGDGTGPKVPGIVEIGIVFTHQNIPDVEGYKSELKAWLEDSDFWSTVDPYISVLTKEVYPDMRYWGVAGSNRNQRIRHLTQYMEHVMNLVDDGPDEIGAARSLLERSYMPLASGTWAAKGPGAPDPCAIPFSCGHGWTMMPLPAMLNFVSEEVYAVRHYAGSHPQGPPGGRIGFSWQPTNNFALPAAEWLAARQAIAARLAAAIHYAYGPGGSADGACTPPDTEEDWCQGADVPDAAFTDAWEVFEHWGDVSH